YRASAIWRGPPVLPAGQRAGGGRHPFVCLHCLEKHTARPYPTGRHRHIAGRHTILPGHRVSTTDALGGSMLKISHLAVAYGRREVIADLSVQGLLPGTVTALLGPNGSGKSTLLKALAGMVRTPRGSISLDGEELVRASLEQRARRLVYLPQSL